MTNPLSLPRVRVIEIDPYCRDVREVELDINDIDWRLMSLPMDHPHARIERVSATPAMAQGDVFLYADSDGYPDDSVPGFVFAGAPFLRISGHVLVVGRADQAGEWTSAGSPVDVVRAVIEFVE